ncbi:MAG: patatin-like phospholipase family protein [Myxococcota bacterium]
MDADYTTHAETVTQAEGRRIGREARWGLALSGGGVRSASFGLGVLQGLVRKGRLDDIDYLSTVSGGGYIGSSLTWFLSRRTDPARKPGTTTGRFPFEQKLVADGEGVRANPVLEFIRQHGNYLIPGEGLNATSLAAVVLRGMTISLFIYGGLLTALFAVLCLTTLLPIRDDPAPGVAALAAQWTSEATTGPDAPAAPAAPEGGEAATRAGESAASTLAAQRRAFTEGLTDLAQRVPLPPAVLSMLDRSPAEGEGLSLEWAGDLFDGNRMLGLSALLSVLFLGLSVVYAVGSSSRWVSRGLKLATAFSTDAQGLRYDLRARAQRGFGRLLTVILGVTLVGLVPVASRLLSDVLAVQAGGAAGGATVLGSLLGFLKLRSEQSDPPAKGDAESRPPSTTERILTVLRPFQVYLAAFLVLFGVLVGCYAIVQQVGAVWSLAAGGVAALVGGLANLNYHGHHRMYRDRLMETFMPDFDRVGDGDWGHATEADDALIEDMCAEGWNERPYHLINTNVVLVDSGVGRYRGRGGDNFILSPLYCGSDATGWSPSRRFMKSRWGRGMTLPTAMAISGAAANPNTGVAGAGAMRSRVVSVLMSLLNLRLGYWAPNPGRERRWLRIVRRPNFLKPGLGAVVGRGLSETRDMIELSDGGHFENLGLYELVRRRLPHIIVVDAGCDPDFAFADLSNAVERVRTDFGVEIDFSSSPNRLAKLLPNEPYRPAEGKIEVAEHGYATATIVYPEVPDPENPEEPKRRREKGELIYIKSTLIKDLPLDVYSYRLQHDAFPHETTADQFFTEAQLEAYRALGLGIAMSLPA